MSIFPDPPANSRLPERAVSATSTRNGSASAPSGVSVLLPAYNVERFVDAALASVQAQTFSNWEVIAVDDGSTDRTHERLLEWSRRDARIRVYHNEGNQGMTGNWNCCLAHARREFVLKLDADDVLRPRTLEVLTAAVDRADIVGAGVRTLLCSVDLEPFDGLPADDAMMHAGIDPYQDHRLACRRWSEIAFLGHQLW